MSLRGVSGLKSGGALVFVLPRLTRTYAALPDRLPARSLDFGASLIHRCHCPYLPCSSGPLLLGRGAAIHPRRFLASATFQQRQITTSRCMMGLRGESPASPFQGCVSANLPKITPRPSMIGPKAHKMLKRAIQMDVMRKEHKLKEIAKAVAARKRRLTSARFDTPPPNC